MCIPPPSYIDTEGQLWSHHETSAVGESSENSDDPVVRMQADALLHDIEVRQLIGGIVLFFVCFVLSIRTVRHNICLSTLWLDLLRLLLGDQRHCRCC